MAALARGQAQAEQDTAEPAPTPAPAPAPAPAPPLIGAVSVAGAGPIGAARLSSSYEPYLGLQADGDVLGQLARSIADEAQRRGYLFASAAVPPQAVEMGVVKVALDLGAVDEVQINGSSNRRLRRILDRLVGPAPRRRLVERQLMLAEDLPGITVKSTRYDRRDGRGVLVVDVTDRRMSGFAILDAYGSDSQGPVRGRLSAALSNLVVHGDQLSLDLLNTVAQPEELAFVTARYAVVTPDGASQLGVVASGGVSHPGEDLARFDLEGRTLYTAAFASRAVRRSKNGGLWVNTEVAYLHQTETVRGVRLQTDEIVTASAGVSVDQRLGESRVSAGVSLVQGAARDGRPGYRRSRSDADDSFTKAMAWAAYARPLPGGFSVRATASGQAASGPLLASQEVGLGGPGFGRAYDFSERFGDEGVMASVEVRRALPPAGPLDALQAYVFVDGGKVRQLGLNGGDARLSSAGVGLRAQAGSLELGLEAAAPLDNDRRQSGDRSPRLNLVLRHAF